ncbi:MAG: NAD(P)H-hydrate dehydratase [Verrucomicrobiaceae bacterium]
MVTCAEMQKIEELAFEKGATPEALMEKVGRRMAGVILRDHATPGSVIAFLGKGHNAGDALVMARHLKDAGWAVEVRSAFRREELAPLTGWMWNELGDDVTGFRRGPLLLLDGLLGIGSEGALREPLAGMAEEMNRLRITEGARTIAMDLPSGLNADTGEGGAVIADHTLTVGIPKRGLIADRAIDFVGRLSLIEVEELPCPGEGDRLTTAGTVRNLLPPRPFSFHKGMAGKIAIIAGAPGTRGAASLCATGALRGGGGLISLYVEPGEVELMLPLLPPEIMLRERPENWHDLEADAFVIGPGLGTDGKTGEKLTRFLQTNSRPLVLDADALNLIAENNQLSLLGENVLATPHPGEMARLVSGEGTRAERARRFTSACAATLLLKGARTIVTQAEKNLHFNTTGTPAMATGGQGDLLSGLLGALMASGLSPFDAARAGAYLAGRAAELALVAGATGQSLTPGDVATFLGRI